MRSERSRSSRTSTKLATSTLNAGMVRTGCEIRTLFSVTVAKPAAAAVTATISGNAIGRLRASTVIVRHPAASAAAAHQAGSRSAVK